MTARVMSRAERRHYEDFYSFASLEFEALRPTEKERPIVRGFINDSDADIIFYFGPFESDQEAAQFSTLLEKNFHKVIWDSDGPFETNEEDEDEDEEDEDGDN